ncbi:hypothetical protein [Chryseosolibacter indicus]|uniref:DUF3375 domain-containing protein n=1 Tax=Chryseosolibacter indicus TaxID=2782351 RepID=A0ABS5VYP3_9BACT|nr:hypothetical protein [Chryseosolibacter indicus]MBT1705874.1 hypothetical protein [Chryseosolibacter indicus]
MDKDLLISLSKSYTELIPQNEESLLLIVWLYYKIEKGYISENFEERDLDDTIEDVAEFLQKGQIQKEVLSRKLSSHYYITESRGSKYYVHLTVYAKELCRLIINQVQPEIKKLELFHVFKRTLPINDEDISEIESLKYWHKNNFLPAQKEIVGHTELLQLAIEEKILELRNLLKPDVDNPKELINSFVEIFKGLEEQTIGLINTLDYKNETVNKIKSAREKFTTHEEVFTEYDRIQRDIEAFFENIDYRIYSINERIQLASKRLRNLLDSLKHKQMFKVKIEKLLQYLLKNSYHEKGEIRLPEKFPRKYLPYFYQKFLAIPKLDFKFYANAKPDEPDHDNEHEEAERKKGFALLKVQESTAQWLDKINDEIGAGNKIQFEEWLDKIMEKEGSLEVAINVCFGLIEQHNASKGGMIAISKEEVTRKHMDLVLWKMQISNS